MEGSSGSISHDDHQLKKILKISELEAERRERSNQQQNFKSSQTFTPKFQTAEGFKVLFGKKFPLGVSKDKDATNFAVFCDGDVKKVRLVLFYGLDSEACFNCDMNKAEYENGNIWYVMVDNMFDFFTYGFEIDSKPGLVLDPLAKSLITRPEWGKTPDYWNFATFPRNGLVKDEFDWDNDTPLKKDLKDLIIYEMHIRGFTIDSPDIDPEHRGTFLGVIDKIPYLLDLGITAIELLPIFEFDELECPFTHPITKTKLKNYWGYSSTSFFSPMRRFATKNGDAITEFKTMVKALHKVGIEVILDVVYNHTGGRWLSTLAKETYYLIDKKGWHVNISGCGNTLNCNKIVTLDLIMASLVYWAQDMHVDGFRFDEAPILGRSTSGQLMDLAPLLVAISNEPKLGYTKMIAEAWDAGGAYQLGKFANDHFWCEWNGKFRDTVRNFIKGTDGGHRRDFATRISGSKDVYQLSPSQSINFVTCHDGFSLCDLVSYQQKHNWDNGEKNQDGINDNESWNCGHEGVTQDYAISVLRKKQMKNFALALMISRGTPMILMGDEYGHSKNGNNNTWCQDNVMNWFNWKNCQENAGFVRFWQKLCSFRQESGVIGHDSFLDSKSIEWHGAKPFQPDWKDDKNRLLCCMFKDHQRKEFVYVAFNAFWKEILVELPHQELIWMRVIDTSLKPPYDFLEGKDMEPASKDGKYLMKEHSAIMFKAAV